MKPKKVWIIGVDAETGRYTPEICPIKEVSKWTSERYYLTYEDCLTQCQYLNHLHGKY